MPLSELTRPIVMQFTGHFAAGIALAVGDRLLSRPLPSGHRQRLQEKHDALLLLAHLRDLETGAPHPTPHPLPDTAEVQEAGAYIRDLVRTGELELGGLTAYGDDQTPLGEIRSDALGWWERLTFWFRHEKVNPLSVSAKLKLGYAIEVGADILVAISAAVWGRGNTMAALGHSLYQGLALGLGMTVGGFLFRRRDRVPRKLRKEVAHLEHELDADPVAIGILRRILESAGNPMPGGAATGALPPTGVSRTAGDEGA